MSSISKSILDRQVLKEEALRELYEALPELISLNDEEREILDQVAENLIIELSQLPFLEKGTIKYKACLQSIKHAKGAMLDVAAIKKLQAQNAILQCIQSVLVRAVKVAIAI